MTVGVYLNLASHLPKNKVVKKKNNKKNQKDVQQKTFERLSLQLSLN